MKISRFATLFAVGLMSIGLRQPAYAGAEPQAPVQDQFGELGDRLASEALKGPQEFGSACRSLPNKVAGIRLESGLTIENQEFSVCTLKLGLLFGPTIRMKARYRVDKYTMITEIQNRGLTSYSEQSCDDRFSRETTYIMDGLRSSERIKIDSKPRDVTIYLDRKVHLKVKEMYSNGVCSVQYDISK